MGWWTSLVDGVNTIGTKVGEGISWAWNNASISRISTAIFTYPINTAFHILEQGLALRKAVPNLYYNPEARKLVGGMVYVMYHDVLPIVALTYGTNAVHEYYRQGHDNDPLLAPYSLFLGSLTLVKYGAKAYAMSQATQLLVHTTILDAAGPSALKPKDVAQLSICPELACDFKRKGKGMLREPIILAANDLMVGAVSYIPYIGMPVSQALQIFLYGRYITRLATKDVRCERHFHMMQESVLALGLGYYATTWIMDYLFEATIGLPPALYYRTMRHLLLLLHVNVAAHMQLPLVLNKDATIPIDPINIYERVCRFIADVIFSGLIVRLPIDFKPEKDAPPLIPLGKALQFGTSLLEYDLEREVVKDQKIEEPGFFEKARNQLSKKLYKTVDAAKPWVIPSMFHSIDDLINDPIIGLYWPGMRKGAIDTIVFAQKLTENQGVKSLAAASKMTAWLLYYSIGVPKKLTRFALEFTQDKDAKDFIEALRMWFARHDIKVEVKLVGNRTIELHSNGPLLEAPVEEIDEASRVASADLVTTRNLRITGFEPEDLLSGKSSSVIGIVSEPSDLLPLKTEPEISNPEELLPDRHDKASLFIGHHPDALFSRRRRKATVVVLDEVDQQTFSH